MKEQAAQAWVILFLNGFVLFIFSYLILRDVALILDTWKEMFVSNLSNFSGENTKCMAVNPTINSYRDNKLLLFSNNNWDYNCFILLLQTGLQKVRKTAQCSPTGPKANDSSKRDRI